MRYRPVGQSGIQASVVGFGAWAIGGWMWGGCDDETAVKAVQKAIDVGMNLIDTAPAYGFGRSEEIIGRAIAGRRDRVVLATKCGLCWHVSKGDFFFEAEGHRVYRYLHPDSIAYEVEQSLKRLKTDRIDILQTHWQETTTPVEETMAALVRLKEQGKIRAIGVSNVTVAHLEKYRSVGPVDNIQERYSMIDRKIEAELIPYCIRHGIAVFAYSPLEQGLLTGKVGPDRKFNPGDQRVNKPRFSLENRKKIADMLEEFRPIAEKHSLTLGQLAIAWTVAQPGLTHALVGARAPEQVAENAVGGGAVLEPDDLKKMDEIIARHAPGIK